MKRILPIFLLIGLFTGWTNTELAMFGAYMGFHATDWRQTLVITGDDSRHELNPILGPYPSKAKVNRYFAATLVTSYFAADLAGSKWRLPLIVFMTIFEGAIVNRNIQVGIKF